MTAHEAQIICDRLHALSDLARHRTTYATCQEIRKLMEAVAQMVDAAPAPEPSPPATSGTDPCQSA